MLSNCLLNASAGPSAGSAASSQRSVLAQFTWHSRFLPPSRFHTGRFTYIAPSSLQRPFPPPGGTLLEERDYFYPLSHCSHFTRSLAHGWDFISHDDNSRSNNSRCPRHMSQPGLTSLVSFNHSNNFTGRVIRLPAFYRWGHWDLERLKYSPGTTAHKWKAGIPVCWTSPLFPTSKCLLNRLRNARAFQNDCLLLCKVEHCLG